MGFFSNPLIEGVDRVGEGAGGTQEQGEVEALGVGLVDSGLILVSSSCHWRGGCLW